MKHEAGSEARNTTHMGTPQMSEVLTPGGKFKALSIPLLAQTSTMNATHHSSQGHRHDNFFPQIVPIIGALASEEQICALTHTSRGRSLPCLAGMVMTATERLPNALFKMRLNASGIVMLSREVQP